MIPLLPAGAPFPDVKDALQAPNGLLAASQELAPERLIDAYRNGIFPWYNEGEPVLWWSPDPRMILVPHEFRLRRSLRKTLDRVARNEVFTLRLDTAFESVMGACAAPRSDQAGTWISEAVIDAYCELHRRGLAHSVECWADGELVGGLYGVSIGRMFYGESMFARRTDASKIALATLVRILLKEKVAVIDCQQATRHLASLGAREVTRIEFCKHVAVAVKQAPIVWAAYQGIDLNPLLASR